jgi:uncharacterized protein (TIGR03435 family)
MQTFDLWIATVLPVTLAMLQSQTEARPPAFDVASVRPANPSNKIIGLFTYPGGRITVSQYTLEMLIEDALDCEDFQIEGGPPWLRADRFDIEAKPPSSSKSINANPPYRKAPPNDEQRQMLLTLLTERFQLKFHRKTQNGPVYLLRKGAKTLQLHEPKDLGGFPWAGFLKEGMAGENISMPQFARRLSTYLRRPVLDRTGLTGSFDFKLKDPPEDSSDLTSSVITSVRGIGLKLEAAREPADIIVIDSAQKLSPN